MKPIAILTALLGVFSMQSSASSWMLFDDANSPLPSNSITSTYNDGDVTWIGTDNGLAKFDGIDWTIYQSESSPLPGDHIYDIHSDAEGNIWLATNNGLVKMTASAWETYNTTNSGLPTNQLRSITTDAINNLWIGTWGAGLARFDGTNWQVFDTQNSEIPSNGIFEVGVDQNQRIWVGTYNGGVAMLDNHGWEVFDTENSDLPNDNVRTLTFDSNGVVWMGTDDGLARKTTSGHWDVFTYLELGHSVHTIHQSIQVESGHVYFATDGGLVEFEGAEYSVYTVQNSNLPSNNLRCVSQDQNDHLWIGTGNNGVAIFSPDGTLAVDDETRANFFKPYPNPTSGLTILDLSETVGSNFEILVHNSLGQMVYRENLKNYSSGTYQLNLEDLPPGALSITILSDRKTDTKRVLKT